MYTSTTTGIAMAGRHLGGTLYDVIEAKTV